MFVVLTGGDPGEEGRKPARRPAEFNLIGERFERLVFPAMVGQMVVIRNLSTKSSTRGVTPRLDAPGNRDIFENPGDAGNPLNPKDEREVTIKKALTPIELRDLDSVHLRAYLVGVPHNLFAIPDAAGKFKIEGVPPGKWTVRVWYETGWLEGADTAVEVAQRGDKSVTINIPPALSTTAPAESK